MNSKKKNNLISVLIYFIMFFLISAIIFFCIYVYKDQLLEKGSKIVSVAQEGIHEIATKLPENNDEQVEIISIEPVISRENDDYNNINNVNTFYYDQLDDYSKMIYDALYINKETLKTGTEKIPLSNEIAKMLTTDEGVSKIEVLFSTAVNAFEYDNPDVFYIDFSKMVLYYESDFFGNSNAYIEKNSQENNYLIEGFNGENDIEVAENKLNSTIDSIKENINSISGEYDKIKYVHDYIVKNTKYDETLNRSNRNTIYGALIEKQATCGGYAKAFKYIMDKIEINSIVIQGKAFRDGASEYHAWNYVNLYGSWYAIDCTWDDPIVQGISEENKKIYYDYFLKNGKTFDDHTRFETFYGTNLIINYPELSLNNY